MSCSTLLGVDAENHECLGIRFKVDYFVFFIHPILVKPSLLAIHDRCFERQKGLLNEGEKPFPAKKNISK